MTLALGGLLYQSTIKYQRNCILPSNFPSNLVRRSRHLCNMVNPRNIAEPYVAKSEEENSTLPNMFSRNFRETVFIIVICHFPILC